MSLITPTELAQYMQKKKVLLLTGSLCDKVELDGKKLLDYAAEVALKLKAPVAATANTASGLKAKGVDAKKKIAAEMVDYMRYEEWREPIMPQKPEVLLFIGYPTVVAKGLVSATKGVATVVLSNSYIEEATFSFPDSSLQGYQQNLEALLQNLSS